jgi:ABC-type siderophore export system fused ATPase/permease subunit
LVISHDDRYYGVADRILKLERGRVTYEGRMEGYVESLTRQQDSMLQAAQDA